MYNSERRDYYKRNGSSRIEEDLEKLMRVNLWRIIDMKEILINLLKEMEDIDRRKNENISSLVIEGNPLVKNEKSSESFETRMDEGVDVMKEPTKEVIFAKKVKRETPVLINNPKLSTRISIQRSKPEEIKIEIGKENEPVMKSDKTLEIFPIPKEVNMNVSNEAKKG
jgi:hypothetical protein